MKVEKIQKLQDKELVLVAGQKNCSVVGKPIVYIKGQDCLNDCQSQNHNREYKSVNY